MKTDSSTTKITPLYIKDNGETNLIDWQQSFILVVKERFGFFSSVIENQAEDIKLV
jgi:hypothetical protein